MTLDEGYEDGLLSIWWYTNDHRIIGKSCSIDNGFTRDNYISYSNYENHLILWSQVIKENYPADIANDIISQGYKSLERGRVTYNIRTQCYEIICSKAIINDQEFRNKIINYCNLRGCRRDFIPLIIIG